MIPYGHQTIDVDDWQAIKEALDSGWLTQGPKVSEFEKQLADYCGSQNVVVVNSGTAALHCALFAANINKGDEVIVPANTFVATSNAVLYVGAKPVFCDIRLDTYNIDETKIEELINEKTKAIIPVHFAGHPCEMEKIMEIAKKHNLLVIEDASHALGSVYKGQKIGTIGDMTTFSFHPVKPITTAEGGAVATNNKEFYNRMKIFRTHGITHEGFETKEDFGPWYFEMKYLGFNYRISDLQCALGISQLKKIDGFLDQRQRVANYYLEKFTDVKGIIVPTVMDNVKTGWHLFVIRVAKEIRKDVFEKMRQNDIGVQVHYIPVYHHPYYRNNGYDKTYLNNTEEYYQTAISLPIYPELKKEDQDLVIQKLFSFLHI